MHKKYLKNKISFNVIGVFGFLVLSLACQLKVSEAQTVSVSVDEKQIVENNKSLKNSIEENQKLAGKFQDMERELGALKAAAEESQSQYENLSQEKNSLMKTVENVKNSNRNYAQEIDRLEKEMQEMKSSQEIYAQKAAELEEVMARDKSMIGETIVSSVGSSSEEIKEKEAMTLDILSRIDVINDQDEKMKSDAAKAHYNMGNIYFEKGEYEIAAREYYQAVTLMPNDPEAHYNLAFVSGEFLNDHKTALEHYQMYRYLKPNAEDAEVVNKKIMQAKLTLDSRIDSPLDTTK